MKVLLLEGVHQSAVDIFIRNGLEVELFPKALDEDALIAKLSEGFKILGIRSKTRVTEKVLANLSYTLLAVGCFCIGTNQVDLTAANRLGIPVFNAPFANTRSVAELVIGEIISMNRKLPIVSPACHLGNWAKTATGCHEIRGKTLGIVGYGHIGCQLSVLGEALGMSIVFYDIIPKLALSNAVSLPTMDDVFKQADFVTIHVPETESTKDMVHAKHFAMMKKGAKFLNLSRGTVVDLDALAAALKSGHLGGAAVDVYPVEPEANGEKVFESPLQGLDNVILTPHIGGSTMEAQSAIGVEVATVICKFITQGATTGAVNFPEVEPMPYRNCHRILNIHRNVPGTILLINQIVAELKANIQSQTLQCDDNIGIVILDITKDVSEEVHARICKLDAHIKGRICYPHKKADPEKGIDRRFIDSVDVAVINKSGGSPSSNTPPGAGQSNFPSNRAISPVNLTN